MEALQPITTPQVSTLVYAASQKVIGSILQVSKGNVSLFDAFEKLPLELKTEILGMAVTKRPIDLPHAHIRERRTTAYNISHAVSMVCQSWRDIALANPQFWTCIPALLPAQHHAYPSLNNAFYVDLFLQRSGDQPIDVAVYQGKMAMDRDSIEEALKDPKSIMRNLARSDSTSCYSTALMLARLLTEAYRWSSAFLHLYKHFLEDLPVFDLPILKTLNLLIFSNTGINSQYRAPKFIGKTPHLKEVILDEYVSTAPASSIFSNLERFTGIPLQFEHLQESQKTLIYCHIRGRLPYLTLPEPSDPLTFPRLKVLHVASSAYYGPPPRFMTSDRTVLGSICAENLEELIIESSYERKPNAEETRMVISDIVNTTLSSPCRTLMELSIQFHAISFESLRSILELTPILHNLSLRLPSAETLGVLVCIDETLEGGPRPELAPHLQSLTLCVPMLSALDEPASLTRNLQEIKVSRRSQFPVKLKFLSVEDRFEGENFLEMALAGYGEKSQKLIKYTMSLSPTLLLAGEFKITVRHQK